MLSKKAIRMRQVLKQALASPNLLCIMEAHDGLSTRLAEEAGFDAVWASGLAISTAMALRDCNEATWSQLLDHIEFMVDAVNVPILVDGDSGHGNFNNVRRFVQKLYERGIAGVCLEDKVFPKLNSFANGQQELLDPFVFAGFIKAAKDRLADDNFIIIARTEALIAGAGLEDALHRANIYAEAGADAILIHSKSKSPREVMDFASSWSGKTPLVAVPTTYYDVNPQDLQRVGISNLIWANHAIRTVITSLRGTYASIKQAGNISFIENNIASVNDIFELLDYQRLYQDERKYSS
ncbi:phosphoenolpyruvate mutase [Kosakonia quasisacchari]|uniref:phosphoenolpyruvate mutase n=1 Tax=Kosakonia quasisacchari TaxID=2529380 RepID=A0A4R0HND4_9ENTR|nr:phosphoenolpyruvate mutase [Kosakonia quasisacchari]TCC09269.1 phosphoenolpyruvate mutase [Kosakonia quasisacchari]